MGAQEFRRWCAAAQAPGLPSNTDRRGQRLVAIGSYTAAVVSFVFAIMSFVAGPGLSKLFVTNLLISATFALIPQLRRLGPPLTPAVGFIVAATIALIVLSVDVGTGVGLSLYFVVMAAAAPMVVGINRIGLIAVVLVVSVTALVVLHFAVSADTGLLPGWMHSVGFVINAIAASVLAAVLVGSGLRQMLLAERALEDEYRRSEALLDNILPRSVARRLKESAHIDIADAYEDASILFADIAGFTEMSSHTSPADLVRFLDRLYTELDRLVAVHGLEKIKTTGDSYMVVSGVPEPRPDHLPALASFALEMHEVCASVASADGTAMEMRIGLADGPVVAGVIGSTKFFYDVWGDAVNMASRMESTGVPGRIQVSQSVYERLRDQFVFHERGIVPVKGKEDQHTWFLVGTRVSGRHDIEAGVGPV